jgi:hypothetical protein
MKRLWDSPPGIHASDSRSAARRRASDRRTVLDGKGSLRRGKLRRALASCAPFCNLTNCDGRLRREPDAKQFFVLPKTKTRWQLTHIHRR